MSDPKILLVEDDKTMVSLLSTLLSFEGFNVVHLDRFNDLNHVMNGIRNEQPDLILLDVNLDGLDGFELLKHIRKLDSNHSIRVLMSSGIDFSDRCNQEGADGFILKPYMPDYLIETMKNTLADS